MTSHTAVATHTLVRTELLALQTIRTPWVFAAATAVTSLALALSAVLDAGKAGAASIGTAAAMLGVLDAIAKGSFGVLLIGVLMTSEFRHGTATAAFLATPRRVRMTTVKAMTVTAVGAALAVVNLAIVLSVGLPTGAVQPSMLNGDIQLRVLGLMLTYPMYGVLGVGIGAVLISQPLAVVVPLAWVLLEPGLFGHLPHVLTPWSLGSVSAAVANAGNVAAVLPMLAGALALTGYAVLVLAFGSARVVRRDIT